MEELTRTESTVITYTDYRQYKAELDAELEKSAESFIRIGYLLKVARDTGILQESGYANVNEFAQKEYGLDKTQVSRFIRINDRFSEDGYSETLKLEYKGYGYAKLAIMLQLPDSINEELTPEYSKAEIQAVKEEIDEENKISDLEVLMEEKDQRQQSLDGPLVQVMYQLGKDDPELYISLHKACCLESVRSQDIYDVLDPAGNKIYMVRIQGTGRVALGFHGIQNEVSVLKVRENTKELYQWEEVERVIKAGMNLSYMAESSWEELYGEEFPTEKAEVAPVQQEEEKKPVPRKESKVVKAKIPQVAAVPKPAPEATVQKPVPETTAQEAAVEEEKRLGQQSANTGKHPVEAEEMTLHDIQEDMPEPQPVEQKEGENENHSVEDTAMVETENEQVPGQSSIENFPEYMPAPESKMTYEQLYEKAINMAKYNILGRLELYRKEHLPEFAIEDIKEEITKLLGILEKLNDM